MDTNYDSLQRIEGFVSKDHANDIFVNLLKEMTFIKCKWSSEIYSTPECGVSNIYPRNAQIDGAQIPRIPELDKLVDIVENKLSTKVFDTYTWIYGDGYDHMCRRQIFSDRNLLHIFVGTSRKLVVSRNGHLVKSHKMTHGDAFFIPSIENIRMTKFSVPVNKNVKSCTMHICFAIDKPFDYVPVGVRDIGTINIFGVGQTEISYDTRHFPNGVENLTAVNIMGIEEDEEVRLIGNIGVHSINNSAYRGIANLSNFFGITLQ